MRQLFITVHVYKYQTVSDCLTVSAFLVFLSHGFTYGTVAVILLLDYCTVIFFGKYVQYKEAEAEAWFIIGVLSQASWRVKGGKTKRRKELMLLSETS